MQRRPTDAGTRRSTGPNLVAKEASVTRLELTPKLAGLLGVEEADLNSLTICLQSRRNGESVEYRLSLRAEGGSRRAVATYTPPAGGRV